MTVPSPPLSDCQFAELLNRGCVCRTLDEAELQAQLESEPALAGLAGEIAATRPSLFSHTAVFISRAQYQAMASLARQLHALMKLPTYQALALAHSPAIAQHNPGPLGAFKGLDFHLTQNGPQLIEANTNAGGALLNLALARAQQKCCPDADRSLLATELSTPPGSAFVEMFRREWQRQRGDVPLRRIAIVDAQPAAQYLYPEFRLFASLLTHHGIEAVIADRADLRCRDGALWFDGQVIDLVYNRATDFYFEDPESAALKDAWLSDVAVITPHPRAHALFASKRNLVTWSDVAALVSLGLSTADAEAIAARVPKTTHVTQDHAETLWANRRHLFFKPAHGFGSRAAYRGDKLTRRVWGEILRGDYVAQALIPPSERRVMTTEAQEVDLKLDVRAYVFGGEIQLLAARLYEGQTTNFRTPGGGFAPVFVLKS